MHDDDDSDWEQDEWDESDTDEESSDQDEDDDGYVPCPHCGEQMYEDAGYCSSCQTWISREDSPQKSMPPATSFVIWLLIAALAIGAVVHLCH